MGPKKGRRVVRKIEIPTDSPPEFELGDKEADIQLRREEREAKEKEEEDQKQRKEARRGGGRKLHTQQRREWKKSMQGQTKMT